MKNDPMIKPATAAENTEITKIVVEPTSLFSNSRLYPLKNVRTSNTMDAAKKPKKWRAVGLTIMLIISAMKPTKVGVTSFLTHHTASIKAEKPIMSQQKGR